MSDARSEKGYVTIRPTQEEMMREHHRRSGHAVEKAPRDGEGWGSLVCCGPWGHREQDVT